MNSDLIDRQAAIEEIRTYITKPNISDDELEIKGYNDGLELAISVLSVLPSAQPYTEAEIQKMQDLEQAELEKAFELGKAEALSEIVRCKDCKWRYTQDCPLVIATNYMANHGYGNFESKGDNGFCSWGKRK